MLNRMLNQGFFPYYSTGVPCPLADIFRCRVLGNETFMEIVLATIIGKPIAEN